MVQFQNVSRVYNTDYEHIAAVEDVTFQIEEGEFVFLIGPSGSGKTTIIKMLIRDERPSSGKIFFDNRDITQISRKHVYKLRREIGVIFQDYKLVPEKTAFENVAFAMEAAGKKNSEIMDTVPYVLDIVGLSHRSHSFPKELSGGEQQRIAIARAIANNPKILIADEPTGNLDPASSWDIVQILNKINNWGTTIIMSTHGTDIVNSMSRRVIQMQNGKIIRDDSKGKYEMVSSYEENLVKKVSDDEDSKSETQVEPKSKKKTFSLNISNSESIKNEEEQEMQNTTKKIFSIFKKSKKAEVPISSQGKIDTEEVENESQKAESIEPEIEKTQHSKLHVDLTHKQGAKEVDKTDDSETTKKDKAEETSNDVEEVDDKSFDTIDFENLDKLITNAELSELDLSKTLSKKLKKAKILKVADLIEIGPENLEETLKISSDSVVKIATALEKLIEKKTNIKQNVN